MAPKRQQEDDAARPLKRQKKGFVVGPANLPDGAHKRKVQKIKKDLIHKAKLKKQYAKLKAREASKATPAAHEQDEEQTEPNLEPHPDRQKMLEQQESSESEPEPGAGPSTPGPRKKRPRPQPFKKETELARKRKAEAEARRQARETAEKERAAKLVERERLRKAMAKARRGGPNGQKKLGRESTVLLEKAKRMVGKT